MFIVHLPNKKKRRQKLLTKKEKELAASFAKVLLENSKPLEKGHGLASKLLANKPSMLVAPVKRRITKVVSSLESVECCTAKIEPKVYTGTKLKGIGTMHKSNLVPVFSDEEALDIATMRRG